MEKNSLFISDWTNVVAEERNELVFENRNKNYGAYQIRRNYNRSLFIALNTSALVLILLISIPKILAFFSPETVESIKEVKEGITITFDSPNPIKPDVIIPSPPSSPQLQKATQFVPPVVKNIETTDEPPIKAQTDLTETKIASTTGTGLDENVMETPGVTTFPDIEEKEMPPLVWVEQMPDFPGGPAELAKFLRSNIIYPSIGIQERVKGKVFLKFKVDKEGNIDNIEVLHGVKGYPAFEKEAIRVVKEMPQWKAGKQNGKAVPVLFTLPIDFSLGQ